MLLKADSQSSQCCFRASAAAAAVAGGKLLLLAALSRVGVLDVVTCGRPLQLYVSNKTSGNFDEGVLYSDLWMWKSVVALAGSHQTFSTFFLICTFE